MTDPFLCVKGSHGSIFAMGDAATIAQAGHPKAVSPLNQTAWKWGF